MDEPFKLEHEPGVPAAYIPFRENRISANQVVVSLEGLSFTPEELILDISPEGQVIGVELL